MTTTTKTETAPTDAPGFSAKLVTTRGSRVVRSVEEITELGYERSGTANRRGQRAELQGQPTFRGLVGPMWDGDMLRYEDQRTYDELSR